MSNLFDFKFSPVQNPLKIGYYHWFWLTDGFYWMNVGSQRLFEFSDVVIRYWDMEIESDEQKCMDYQVVRFWEDMLEILPTIIQPVPKAVHKLFLQSHENYQENLNKWLDYVEVEENSGRYKEYELLCSVPFFMNGYSLSTAHLSSSPFVCFWRYQENGKDKIWIGWDFTQTITDKNNHQEIPIWSATKGFFEIDYQDFMNEFQKFNDEFLNKMQERIDDILSSETLKSFYADNFDFSILQNEQNERKKSLLKTLNFKIEIDWETRLFHYQQAGIIQ